MKSQPHKDRRARATIKSPARWEKKIGFHAKGAVLGFVLSNRVTSGENSTYSTPGMGTLDVLAG